ncbi:MAG: conjugal transfer protein TraI [Bacteroidetes bacterium]|nr:conjugal transfer protein TraI [Bacteroidota bacterium]MBS1973400.1 conjugal transfer protein TraI [Bacteroidota bacterium]
MKILSTTCALSVKRAALSLAIILFASVAEAQIPVISVITTLAKKVINAIDLEVENLQNQTVELQNVQKALENAMSKLQLDGITDWVQKIKDLYSEYYQELSQVKQIISDYDKVKSITQLQERIVWEYQSAYALFKQDKHFTSGEMTYMYNVYSGIIHESIKNLEQATLVISPLATQMTDESRLNIINTAFTGMQKNYNDLKAFNSQNIQLSLQRAADANDLQTVKQLYGLP